MTFKCKHWYMLLGHSGSENPESSWRSSGRNDIVEVLVQLTGLVVRLMQRLPCCVSSPGLPSSLRSSFYYPAPIKAKNFSLYLFFTKKLNKLHHASNKLTVGLKKQQHKIGLLTFSELWSMSFKEKRKCWCRLTEKLSYNSMSVSLFTVSRLT